MRKETFGISGVGEKKKISKGKERKKKIKMLMDKRLSGAVFFVAFHLIEIIWTTVEIFSNEIKSLSLFILTRYHNVAYIAYIACFCFKIINQKFS